MAKNSTVFVCSGCGYESSKWLGKCPSCNEWNSFYEEKKVNSTSYSKSKNTEKAEVINLNKIEKKQNARIQTGIQELDRVLGGGFVNGSLTLIRRRTWNWKVNTYITNM